MPENSVEVERVSLGSVQTLRDEVRHEVGREVQRLVSYPVVPRRAAAWVQDVPEYSGRRREGHVSQGRAISKVVVEDGVRSGRHRRSRFPMSLRLSQRRESMAAGSE